MGFPSLYGIQLIGDPTMVEHHSRQTRYPKSKKKRIREKWRKKYTIHWTTPMEEGFQFGDVIAMHPSLIERLRKEFE